MMILRLLGPAGIAGLAVSLCLAFLLVIQKGETRHWKKQAGQFDRLYRGEQAVFAGTVASYRAATEAARVADRVAAARVVAEQGAINERTSYALELRLADARARADRLRTEARTAASNPGVGAAAPVSGVPVAAGRSAQAAGQAELSSDDSLIATEQAIQLDELIKWVKAQAAVEPNKSGN